VKTENAVVLKIVLANMLNPGELPQLLHEIDKIENVDIIIISGRLPVWAFSAISSMLATKAISNPRLIVAVADPKLAGAVVVFPRNRAGETIPLPAEAF